MFINFTQLDGVCSCERVYNDAFRTSSGGEGALTAVLTSTGNGSGNDGGFSLSDLS